MVSTPSFEPVAPVSDLPDSSAPYKFQRSNVGGREPRQRQYSTFTAQSAPSSPFDLSASDDRLPNLLQRAGKQSAYTLLGQTDIINRNKLGRQLAFDIVSIRGYEGLSDDDIEYILTPDGPVAEARKSIANPTVLKLLPWPNDATVCSACSSIASCRPTSRNDDPDPTFNTFVQQRPQSEAVDDLVLFNFCVHCYLSKQKHTSYNQTRELKKWHYPTADPKHKAHKDGCGTTGSWLVVVCGCPGCDDQNIFEEADAWWDHVSKHHSKLDSPKLGQVKHEPDKFSLKMMIKRLVAWHRYAPIWNEITGGCDIVFRHQPRPAVKEAVLNLLRGPKVSGNGWDEERNAWIRAQLLKLHDGLVITTQPHKPTAPEQAQTPDVHAQQPTYTTASHSYAVAPEQAVAPAQQPAGTGALYKGSLESRAKGKEKVKTHQRLRKSSSAMTSGSESAPEQNLASPDPCDPSEFQSGSVSIFSGFSPFNNTMDFSEGPANSPWPDFEFPTCPAPGPGY